MDEKILGLALRRCHVAMFPSGLKESLGEFRGERLGAEAGERDVLAAVDESKSNITIIQTGELRMCE